MAVAHDVLRLQIAMNHAFGMGRVQCTAYLLNDRNGVFGRELSVAAQDGPQILAVDVLHADETNPIRFAQVKNADDIFMRDVARENELLLEAQQDRGVRRQFRTNHLQRDQTIQFTVARFVDGTHAALSQDAQNFVASAEEHPRLQALKSTDCTDTDRRRGRTSTRIRQRRSRT